MVYFIQEGADGPIKIGTTDDPKTRLQGLQTGNPRLLKLLYVMSGDKNLEVRLHKLFRSSCMRGEWFDPTKELTDLIENLNKSGPIAIVRAELATLPSDVVEQVLKERKERDSN